MEARCGACSWVGDESEVRGNKCPCCRNDSVGFWEESEFEEFEEALEED
jgi:hypothetical protein